MAKIVDYYLGMVSPWSYLGGGRLAEIAAAAGDARQMLRPALDRPGQQGKEIVDTRSVAHAGCLPRQWPPDCRAGWLAALLAVRPGRVNRGVTIRRRVPVSVLLKPLARALEKAGITERFTRDFGRWSLLGTLAAGFGITAILARLTQLSTELSYCHISAWAKMVES